MIVRYIAGLSIKKGLSGIIMMANLYNSVQGQWYSLHANNNASTKEYIQYITDIFIEKRFSIYQADYSPSLDIVELNFCLDADFNVSCYVKQIQFCSSDMPIRVIGPIALEMQTSMVQCHILPYSLCQSHESVCSKKKSHESVTTATEDQTVEVIYQL